MGIWESWIKMKKWSQMGTNNGKQNETWEEPYLKTHLIKTCEWMNVVMFNVELNPGTDICRTLVVIREAFFGSRRPARSFRGGRKLRFFWTSDFWSFFVVYRSGAAFPCGFTFFIFFDALARPFRRPWVLRSETITCRKQTYVNLGFTLETNVSLHSGLFGLRESNN